MLFNHESHALQSKFFVAVVGAGVSVKPLAVVNPSGWPQGVQTMESLSGF
jgi:hypothetical protein